MDKKVNKKTVQGNANQNNAAENNANQANANQNNAVSKDMDQLLVELGWIKRDSLSAWLAIYGSALVFILRLARYIAKLDEINKTNYAESTYILGMLPKDIIDTFPRIADELFLVLAIQSTELSYENLVNLNFLSGVTQTDITNTQKGLQASFFAYLAAKLSYDIDVGTQLF